MKDENNVKIVAFRDNSKNNHEWELEGMTINQIIDCIESCGYNVYIRREKKRNGQPNDRIDYL